MLFLDEIIKIIKGCALAKVERGNKLFEIRTQVIKIIVDQLRLLKRGCGRCKSLPENSHGEDAVDLSEGFLRAELITKGSDVDLRDRRETFVEEASSFITDLHGRRRVSIDVDTIALIQLRTSLSPFSHLTWSG